VDRERGISRTDDHLGWLAGPHDLDMDARVSAVATALSRHSSNNICTVISKWGKRAEAHQKVKSEKKCLRFVPFY
jgi:hypothetical protein